MANKNLITNLIILGITIANLISDTTSTKAEAVAQTQHSNTAVQGISCRSQENYELRVSCRQREAEILASTVQIEMSGWHWVGGQKLALTKGGKSHATVVDNRYLVSHNHYRYSLLEAATGEKEGYTGISLRKMDGSLILEEADLSVIRIVYEADQILVLELIDALGRNLLADLELHSAEALGWHSVDWHLGMEIAHIDWDGETAHVDWVTVEKVITSGEVAYIEVDNYALKGSSGGGAYWNGYHIGNVWAHNLEKDASTGNVTRLYTMIALNTAEVAELH